MPAYRHGKYISQAIEGVLAQKCDFPFELIISEDCSPDKTLDIALEYHRSHPDRIRVITGNQNVGMHKNFQRSIPLCRGKYIAVCEGDDFWHHPQKLQIQVDMMESCPEMAFCHTDYDRLTRFRKRRNVHSAAYGPNRPALGDAYGSLLRTWTVMTATTVHRRTIVTDFMQSPFYEPTWPFGDLNLLLYASLRGRVGYLDLSTATFRKMRGSATNSGAKARLRMQQAHSECVDMFINAHPPASDIARKARATRRKRIYDAAFMVGDTLTMEECRRWLLDNDFEFDEGRHWRRARMIQMGWPHRLLAGARSIVNKHFSAT